MNFVVESPVEIKQRQDDGTIEMRTGTSRVWVETEDRAKAIIQQGLDAVPPVTNRTYRPTTAAEREKTTERAALARAGD
ncbi:MAG: hypothetical protein M3Z05_18820 [Gemmatimonadota bacterium]|nr:hypothetical protein [Gemmatimonadota bacterium]